MKTLLAFIIATTAIVCRAGDSNLQAFLEQRGNPLAVVSGFKKEEKKLRTVSLFGLNQSALGPLKESKERVLVYSSDPRFARAIGYHFQDLADSSSHVGWTMFATMGSGTTLELVRFSAEGRLIDQTRLVIDVAYLEEVAEGNLVRIKPEKKEPNQPLQRNASTRSVPSLKSPARRG
ncbi:MAG: hypothetical protein QM760_04275 [Nibricoccus sp.]